MNFIQIFRNQCFSFLLLMSSSFCFAQVPSRHTFLSGVDLSDFFAVQAAINNYYKTYPGAKGETQWRRREWFLEPRLYPHGKMENLTLKTFTEQERYFKQYPQQRSTHGGWLFLGPSKWEATTPPANNNGLGRINSIDFHPTNDNIIYAGTANGGLWRTLNGGTSWANLSPHIPLLSVADVEVDYTNPNIIYLLTGDGDHDFAGGSTAHEQQGATSIGVLKTTDGGSTWYPTGFSFNQPSSIIPYKLLMHPTNPEIQFITSTNGLYKTDDGWDTYSLDMFIPIFDIEFNAADPSIMFAAGRTRLYRSVTTGNYWSQIVDADFAAFDGGSRIELGVSPDNSNVIYAFGGNSAEYLGFMKSGLNGLNNTWTIQDTSSNDLFLGYGDYCAAVAVDPEDYETIYAANISFAISDNEGLTGSWFGTFPGHPDIHDIQIRNGVVYCAHDGGLWKSVNEGASWIEISSGIACTEVYTLTGTPLNTNVYIIGAQDVGHLKRTSASSTFKTIGCCDGMISIIHPTDINTIYISGQHGGINKTTTGAPPFTSLWNPGSHGAWNTPYIMDHVDPEILFVGKDSIHRTNNGGTSWQYLGKPYFGTQNVMVQAPSNRNRIYTSSIGRMWRTDNALISGGPATWTEISAGLPAQFITGIAIHPDNANTLFVTLSGYDQDEKVYMNTNSGNSGSWVNITGTLPNVPINCIEYYDDGSGDDALYIGTDIGVFYRDNTLGNWVYYSNFLPSASVSDLYINYANSTIAAAVYGRGLWLSNLYDACDPVVTLSGTSTGGTLYYSASDQINSTAVHRFDIGNEVHYKAGNIIDLKDGFRAGGEVFFESKIGPCPSVVDPPMLSPFVPSGRLVMDGLEQTILKAPD